MLGELFKIRIGSLSVSGERVIEVDLCAALATLRYEIGRLTLVAVVGP